MQEQYYYTGKTNNCDIALQYVMVFPGSIIPKTFFGERFWTGFEYDYNLHVLYSEMRSILKETGEGSLIAVKNKGLLYIPDDVNPNQDIFGVENLQSHTYQPPEWSNTQELLPILNGVHVCDDGLQGFQYISPLEMQIIEHLLAAYDAGCGWVREGFIHPSIIPSINTKLGVVNWAIVHETRKSPYRLVKL